MKASRDERFPNPAPLASALTQDECDELTDNQLKATFFGKVVTNMLSDAAKRLLRLYKKEYTIKSYDGRDVIDGPSLFFYISKIVDPDNGHLVDEVTTKMRKLHIKNFWYSSQKLMAEFQNMMEQISDLGAGYGNDEMLLDFWSALRTMKEPEFLTFC